jgi:hypothetical protein
MESMIGSIYSILSYSNAVNECEISKIEKWINQYSFPDIEHKINGSTKNAIHINKDQLKKWQQKGYTIFIKETFKEMYDNDLSNEKFESHDRDHLLKETGDCFVPIELECINHNEEFSILTHHKSNLFIKPYSRPILTLGVVVKQSNKNKYFVCIQQRCDSLRLGLTEERPFLFLPLEICERKFSIIHKEGENYLKFRVLSDNCFYLTSFFFRQNHKGVVLANCLLDDFYFKDIHSQSFKWVLDLKFSQAQKIANNFSSKLSRVGLDESEWLRRS